MNLDNLCHNNNINTNRYKVIQIITFNHNISKDLYLVTMGSLFKGFRLN